MKLITKFVTGLCFFAIMNAAFADTPPMPARIYIENDANQPLNLQLFSGAAVPDLHPNVGPKTNIPLYVGGFDIPETGADVVLLATFGSTPTGYHSSKLSIHADNNDLGINGISVSPSQIYPDDNTICDITMGYSLQNAYFAIKNCQEIKK